MIRRRRIIPAGTPITEAVAEVLERVPTEPYLREEWWARRELGRFYQENKLPDYDPAARCPKCNHTPSLNYPGAVGFLERFERRCERCLYVWDQQVPVERREFRRCPYWIGDAACKLRVGHTGDHVTHLEESTP